MTEKNLLLFFLAFQPPYFLFHVLKFAEIYFVDLHFVIDILLLLL